jgi:hypothetical protein
MPTRTRAHQQCGITELCSCSPFIPAQTLELIKRHNCALHSGNSTRHTKDGRLEDALLSYCPVLHGFGRGHQPKLQRLGVMA